MTSIYIGVCKTRDDERFRESFRNFTDTICRYYSVCMMTVKDTFLPDAQNKIVKDFLQGNHQYLLLLDDDQWGHTKEMLDCLIAAKSYVVTMKTYSRHYPYACALANRLENGFLVPLENGEGYQECDLTGFPMTLIRRDTFDKLKEPYFRAVEDGGRSWNTDVDFFQRLAEVGIRPVGCFQYCLNHDKITEENVKEYRHKETTDNNNGLNRLLKDIENGTFVVRS